jgi:murein L,D-transpeptidase YafK
MTVMIVIAVVLSVGVAAQDAEPARVAAARASKLAGLKQKFEKAGVAYPAKQILVRAFKDEGELELWAGNGKGPLVLVTSWPICAKSGALGPKRKQGDLQVPEGVYTIDQLNPWSSFHLSLHVDYPNKADKAAAKKLAIKDPGGQIMVHGNCVTIGCIPIEDDPIEELYLAILDAHLHPPIHIFPARLDETGLARVLALDVDAETKRFWREELTPLYRAFEAGRRVPQIIVDANGRYKVKQIGNAVAME